MVLFNKKSYDVGEDSQIDFGTQNVNLTYGGGRGFQPMTFRKRSKIP